MKVGDVTVRLSPDGSLVVSTEGGATYVAVGNINGVRIGVGQDREDGLRVVIHLTDDEALLIGTQLLGSFVQRHMPHVGHEGKAA